MSTDSASTVGFASAIYNTSCAIIMMYFVFYRYQKIWTISDIICMVWIKICTLKYSRPRRVKTGHPDEVPYRTLNIFSYLFEFTFYLLWGILGGNSDSLKKSRSLELSYPSCCITTCNAGCPYVIIKIWFTSSSYCRESVCF